MPIPSQPRTLFTAAIRWRGPDPTIQLETRHPGFATETDALHFAGGSSESSACALYLKPEGLWLMFGDGTMVAYRYDLVLGWIRKSPQDSSFVMCGYEELARRPSSHGKYERAGYAILGPDGSPVRVVIEFNDAAVLDVMVERKGPLNAPLSQATGA